MPVVMSMAVSIAELAAASNFRGLAVDSLNRLSSKLAQDIILNCPDSYPRVSELDRQINMLLFLLSTNQGDLLPSFMHLRLLPPSIQDDVVSTPGGCQTQHETFQCRLAIMPRLQISALMCSMSRD